MREQRELDQKIADLEARLQNAFDAWLANPNRPPLRVPGTPSLQIPLDGQGVAIVDGASLPLTSAGKTPPGQQSTPLGPARRFDGEQWFNLDTDPAVNSFAPDSPGPLLDFRLDTGGR